MDKELFKELMEGAQQMADHAACKTLEGIQIAGSLFLPSLRAGFCISFS